MPPKKKAKKITEKEYREMLLARIASANVEPIGTLCSEPYSSADGDDGASQVRVEMSSKTAVIRGAMVSFYNGRGRTVSCYITNDGDEDAFASSVGKATKFGAETAMSLPADELTVDKIGVEGMDWYEDDDERRKEASKIQAKGSMKHVSCRAKKRGLLSFSRHYDYTLTPFSGVTNDSWAALPEEDSRVRISGEDELQLGKAILQRSVVALSREEAKMHPDGKYHGERRKWADV